MKQFFVALWHKWNLVILPAILKLGFWGAGAVALLDSSTIPVPMDAVLAVWIWKDQRHFWLYAIMAAVGINRERLERIRDRFERQELLALMVPSMLPPPTPFKLFVFSAGVFEMRVPLFMLSVFTGRLIRWLVLALLVIKLGPGAVQIVERHARAVLAIVGGLAVLGFALWWRKKRRRGEV